MLSRMRILGTTKTPEFQQMSNKISVNPQIPKERFGNNRSALFCAFQTGFQPFRNNCNVIDSRYRSKKPLIATTNLKLEEIKNSPDLVHARIYDRILERCAPVLFSGKNFREEGARAIKAAAKEIVSKG